MKYFANADAKYGNAHGRANNVNIIRNVLSARANDKALSPGHHAYRAMPRGTQTH